MKYEQFDNFCDKAFNKSILEHIIVYNSEQGKEFREKYKNADDEEIIENSEYCIRFIPKKYMKDKNFVLKLIEKHDKNKFFGTKIYKYLPEKLRNDIDVIESLYETEIIRDGSVFKYLPKSFRSKEFVLKILNRNEMVSKMDHLYFSLSDKLKKDRDILYLFIKNDASFYTSINKSIRNTKEFVIWSVKIDPRVIVYINKTYKEDKEILYLLLKENIRIYVYLPKYFREDQDILNLFGEDIKKLLNKEKWYFDLFPNYITEKVQLEDTNFMEEIKCDSNMMKILQLRDNGTYKLPEDYVNIYDWTDKWMKY